MPYSNYFCFKYYYLEPPYTYTSSIDYINNLSFDVIESYSLQRGKAYENDSKQMKLEYDRLTYLKTNGANLNHNDEKELSRLQELLGLTQYLVNAKGQFHPSSKKTNTFLSGDSTIDRLKNILRTEVIEVPSWMCAPIYRDALVFYKDKKLVSTLNVCLGCQYMETSMFNHINGDSKTYGC